MKDIFVKSHPSPCTFHRQGLTSNVYFRTNGCRRSSYNTTALSQFLSPGFVDPCGAANFFYWVCDLSRFHSAEQIFSCSSHSLSVIITAVNKVFAFVTHFVILTNVSTLVCFLLTNIPIVSVTVRSAKGVSEFT
jgi:ABC-type Co2+ transport system permease subunit